MSDKDYSQLNTDELKAEIRRLNGNLEDLEDTFTFNLTNTSAHLNAGVVAEAEEELGELRAEIAEIELILRSNQ